MHIVRLLCVHVIRYRYSTSSNNTKEHDMISTFIINIKDSFFPRIRVVLINTGLFLCGIFVLFFAGFRIGMLFSHCYFMDEETI